jgi:hypothetical protein
MADVTLSSIKTQGSFPIGGLVPMTITSPTIVERGKELYIQTGSIVKKNVYSGIPDDLFRVGFIPTTTPDSVGPASRRGYFYDGNNVYLISGTSTFRYLYKHVIGETLWERMPSAFPITPFSGAYSGGRILIADQNSNSSLYYSDDFGNTSWLTTPNPAGSASPNRVCAAGGLFFYFDSVATTSVRTSPDNGFTWTSRNVGVTGSWWDAQYDGTYFYILSNGSYPYVYRATSITGPWAKMGNDHPVTAGTPSELYVLDGYPVVANSSTFHWQTSSGTWNTVNSVYIIGTANNKLYGFVSGTLRVFTIDRSGSNSISSVDIDFAGGTNVTTGIVASEDYIVGNLSTGNFAARDPTLYTDTFYRQRMVVPSGDRVESVYYRRLR